MLSISRLYCKESNYGFRIKTFIELILSPMFQIKNVLFVYSTFAFT